MKDQTPLHEDEARRLSICETATGIELEILSFDPTCSLDRPEDVILMMNGRPLSIESAEKDRLVAQIPAQEMPGLLMVRIDEFFDGWDLFLDSKSEAVDDS